MANVYMGANVEEFIFDENATFEEVKVEETVEDVKESYEPEIEECGVIECFDDPDVACYRIALENEQNYNMIMNAMMMREFAVLESTGEEMVYEAEQKEGFFAVVKKALAHFWSKVQGVFKRVNDMIGSIVANNKAFVKKYKGADIKAPVGGEDRTFSGYAFDNSKHSILKDTSIYTTITDFLPVKASDVKAMEVEAAEKFVADFKSDFEQKKAYMRGAACGDMNKEISADDFNKELHAAFFGEKKKDLKLIPFATLMSELEDAKPSRKAAKDAYKNAKGAVDKLMKEVKTAEAAVRKAEGRKNGGMKVAKCLTDGINACLGIMSKAMSVQTSAIVTKARQDASMAYFYVTHQPKAEKKEKKEATKESSIFENDLGITLI